MRPAPQIVAAAFGWFESGLIVNCRKPLLREHPERGAFAVTVTPKHTPQEASAATPLHGCEDTHMRLYVGNLSFQTTSQDLQDYFSQAGTVESANVVEDRETGRSRGFGFVEMATKEEGEAAIQQLNGNDLNGRNLRVDVAKPRESRDGGRSY